MVRSVWEALAEVPDRRGRRGRHYELRSILGISIAAMLTGANDLRALQSAPHPAFVGQSGGQ